MEFATGQSDQRVPHDNDAAEIAAERAKAAIRLGRDSGKLGGIVPVDDTGVLDKGLSLHVIENVILLVENHRGRG